jgi:hypothetical protein
MLHVLHMLQVFQKRCFRGLFEMFHMFHIYVCCKRFDLNVAYVSHICSNIYFKCFSGFILML